MASSQSSGHQGQVKDPAHDGRLKENRESGNTKGTTPGSEARREHKQESRGQEGEEKQAKGGQKGGETQSRDGSGGGGGGDDLKSREYTDAQGNVHHHTRTYGEQHKSE